MIPLSFLGIGAAFCPALGNTSACFQKDGTLYLLDCGSLVFAELLKRDVLRDAKRLVVFITHAHADHTGSLGTLLSYCHHVHPLPVTVVHPDAALQTLLDANGISRNRYVFCGVSSYRDANVCAAFFPVPHTEKLACFGITVGDGEETVYYSGDAARLPEPVWNDFLAGKIARVYQDAALGAAANHPAHGSYDGFAAACPAALKVRFFPIHWDCAGEGEAILRDGFGLAFCPPCRP